MRAWQDVDAFLRGPKLSQIKIYRCCCACDFTLTGAVLRKCWHGGPPRRSFPSLLKKEEGASAPLERIEEPKASLKFCQTQGLNYLSAPFTVLSFLKGECYKDNDLDDQENRTGKRSMKSRLSHEKTKIMKVRTSFHIVFM
jgi:hypothetical protein